MVLDVDGRRLDARFLDRNGTVRDHFTLRKGEQRWLTRDEPAISVATGGTQILTLAAGPTHANRSYVVAGSFGTSPGFMLGSVQVPLNPDGWLTASLQLANGVNLQNTVGSLNGAGNAQARIVFPPLHPSLAGTVMYHAFV